MAYGDNMKVKKPEMSGASMNTGGGKDPGVKRISKHPIKSGFYNQKKMKGDC